MEISIQQSLFHKEKGIFYIQQNSPQHKFLVHYKRIFRREIVIIAISLTHLFYISIRSEFCLSWSHHNRYTKLKKCNLWLFPILWFWVLVKFFCRSVYPKKSMAHPNNFTASLLKFYLLEWSHTTCTSKCNSRFLTQLNIFMWYQ